MVVKFKIGLISNDPRPIKAGDVVSHLSDAEALRHIKAGHAVPVKGHTIERATIAPREKAVIESAPKKRRRGKNNNRT